MSNKKRVFIKLGGSLISDKKKTDQAFHDVIDKLSFEIANVFLQGKKTLLISTGAGGFAHPIASRYRNNLDEGKSAIRQKAMELNALVVKSLVKHGVNAQTVTPSDISVYKNMELKKINLKKISDLTDKNTAPVFHADLVTDRTKGTMILSMDKFLVDAAIFMKNKGLGIERLVFAGSTFGVCDNTGKTIAKITNRNMDLLDNVFYKGKGIDVTGGMRQKVRECLRLVEYDLEAIIINGNEKGALKNAILGSDVFKATLVTLK